MLRAVLMSDTHGCHRQVDVPDGDLLLHAGDVCDRGNREHVHDFLDWFSSLPHRHKVFISGNHDFDLDTGATLIPTDLPDGISLLNDSRYEIQGVEIWGSRTAAKGTPSDWSAIPDSTDILMTHYPPARILDQSKFGRHHGSRSLAATVRRISPKVHLFGDIHHSHGHVELQRTQYFNASLYKASRKEIIHAPYVIDLDSE